MAKFEIGGIGCLEITVKDLRELLADYDDDVVMRIDGGSDGGWEFVEIRMGEEKIAES